MDKNQIDEFVKLLQRYELSLASFYETLASILPAEEKNWTAFAKEERTHAKWINQLHSQLENENVSFEQTKITIQSTKTAIEYITNQSNKASKDQPDLIQVLNIALNIENSLLESAFLTIFRINAPNAQKIQARLKKATELHIDRLTNWRDSLIG